ncbi:MAG: transglycosylase SLT domain-containing protein [Desulfonauticus sp.]|nr:transglycosylase SLT domain-containing protein [Desulfonauticus sp.]
MKQKALVFLVVLQGVLVGFWLYLKLYYWPGKEVRFTAVKTSPLSLFTPYGPGLDYDIALLFARTHNLKLIWHEVKTFDQAFALLRKNKIDVVVGVPNNIVWEDKSTRKGPLYLKDNFILIHNMYRYPLREFAELCRAKVMVPDFIFFKNKIQEYDNEIVCSINYKIIKQSTIILYTWLAENKARFMLTDKISFQSLTPYFSNLRKTYEFQRPFQFRWIWNKRYTKLDNLLSAFWDNPQTKEKFQELKEIYFGFFKDKIDYYQLAHLKITIKKKLPLHAKTILRVSKQYKIDPLLLIAQIYQESRFDPKARSKTGVRGLLQLSQDTASWIGIKNRLDARQSILGGAKYLFFLANKIQNRGVVGWDKWCMALAAYNQGLGHLYDAMELVKQKGKNYLAWKNIKKIYPLLSYKKYYQHTQYGYCRGYEAISYVENIRYYYYTLRLLAFFGGREGNYLRYFLGRFSFPWP